MSEQAPNLPGVVSGITQQNFDALNGRLAAAEDEATKANEALAALPKFVTGTVELEWNGAGPASNTKEVTHGLGATPADVHLQLDRLISSAGNPELFAFGVELGVIVFKVNATLPTSSVPGTGTKVKFTWTAFG